jgi:hypothetical protein
MNTPTHDEILTFASDIKDNAPLNDANLTQYYSDAIDAIHNAIDQGASDILLEFWDNYNTPSQGEPGKGAF